MGEILILNGSPRAPKSNSKQYADIFTQKCKWDVEYSCITASNHLNLCSELNHFSDVLLVFPLYADGIPVTLLNFLKNLENHLPDRKPVISVLINCGFLEDFQNDTAVKMIKFFCQKTQCPFGSVLKIGSGEAILTTPFKILAVRKIKQLANSITSQKYKSFHVTMPISPGLFVKASTKYWTEYGKRNGITPEKRRTMKIEENE